MLDRTMRDLVYDTVVLLLSLLDRVYEAVVLLLSLLVVALVTYITIKAGVSIANQYRDTRACKNRWTYVAKFFKGAKAIKLSDESTCSLIVTVLCIHVGWVFLASGNTTVCDQVLLSLFVCALMFFMALLVLLFTKYPSDLFAMMLEIVGWLEPVVEKAESCYEHIVADNDFWERKKIERKGTVSCDRVRGYHGAGS